MLRRVFLLLLTIALAAFSLTACGDPSAPTDSSAENSSAGEVSKTDYVVTVQTEGGMPLPGLLVKIYEDNSKSELVFAAATDDKGVLRFNATTSETYVADILGCVAGFFPEESYPVSKETTVKIKTAPYSGFDATAVSLAKGDIVPDLQISCADGSELSIAEVLEEKKAVVLNFWFIGCDPCRMEFPYLQKAYESYQDDLEVIAINPYDGTDATVSAYAERMGLTFPVASEAKYWQNTMQLRVYPTTVVIDRYGMICLVHVGAVTEEETFAQLFAYVTSDSYVQKVYSSIEEMKP